MIRHIAIAIAATLLAAGLVGCEEKKPKPFKTAHTRKAKKKKKKEQPPPHLDDIDYFDRMWNEPPTEGMARVRMALNGQGKAIEGRPSYMASQFRFTAVELIERLHEEGYRPTDRKDVKEFNPNENGRYVTDLHPGHWKFYVDAVDDSWLPWISDPITLVKGKTISINVKLQLPKKLRPKYE